MILQLNPSIPLDTTKGPADAHAIIDYGEQQPLLFVCFLRSSGECWVLNQQFVRLEKNITMEVRVDETQSPF